jgi:hypothetical protein
VLGCKTPKTETKVSERVNYIKRDSIEIIARPVFVRNAFNDTLYFVLDTIIEVKYATDGNKYIIKHDRFNVKYDFEKNNLYLKYTPEPDTNRTEIITKYETEIPKKDNSNIFKDVMQVVVFMGILVFMIFVIKLITNSKK